jgi:hypothetical protein
MKRGFVGLAFVFALQANSGCDISAKPFAGTIVQLVLEGVAPSMPGQHLELWARNANDDIIRINGTYFFEDTVGKRPPATLNPPGLMIRNAIDMSDPCIIDNAGNLLITAAAYPKDTVVAGIKQTPEEQAAQVRARIQQLTSPSNCAYPMAPLLTHCGVQGAGNALAVLPFDPTTRPTVDFNAPAAERLAACRDYWLASPLSYTPNPYQLTAPIHGTLWGMMPYVTTTPVSGFEGLRLDTPVNLKGIRELFLTLESFDADDMQNNRPDGVDPLNRGPVILQGFPNRGGNYVIHFALTGSGGSGEAALYVDLDSDPVQF